MYLLLKIAFAVSLIVLLILALPVVIFGLLSRDLSISFPRLADSEDEESDEGMRGVLGDRVSRPYPS